tara:strand:+ start:993 stop:1373 length:381 start_codon:yes stop_codon:yes gene_type:complete
MKITKTKLKQIISEEVAKLQEKNKLSDIEANLRRADAARQRALAAAKAAEAAEKKKDETHEALNEQEVSIDGLLEEAQIDIEQRFKDFSKDLADVDLDDDAIVSVLNLLLAKLTHAVEMGHVGPPA